MKKENISSLGTVLASLLATSCCIGPAVFVVFGALLFAASFQKIVAWIYG